MKIKKLRLNKLEYNANRDPAIYRRTLGKPFDISVQLEGQGNASASFVVDGKACCERTVTLPGIFHCQVAFESAGTRVGTLILTSNSDSVSRELRLDTLAHAWVG